ncbi:hypothetical protein PoB_006238100 [Plakobranchus ocellatus]|uniref:Uncharacterized protein n=1 Tax=Plakobranchus ocellatus TaxID=259542 RepID=A0AAV4CVE0_9GAST|nr:hypothetical protein PoB_006238100 [Plakobranchus ocellatus]
MRESQAEREQRRAALGSLDPHNIFLEHLLSKARRKTSAYVEWVVCFGIFWYHNFKPQIISLTCSWVKHSHCDTQFFTSAITNRVASCVVLPMEIQPRFCLLG